MTGGGKEKGNSFVSSLFHIGWFQFSLRLPGWGARAKGHLLETLATSAKEISGVGRKPGGCARASLCGQGEVRPLKVMEGCGEEG